MINPRPTTHDPRPETRTVPRLGSGIRDRIFIINTILFVVVGGVILYRSALGGLTVLAVIVGGGFMAFGVYRLRWVWRYGKQAGRGS